MIDFIKFFYMCLDGWKINFKIFEEYVKEGKYFWIVRWCFRKKYKFKRVCISLSNIGIVKDM